MDIALTIPDQHLPLLNEVLADQGFVDPGGTPAQRKAALAAWIVDRLKRQLILEVRQYNRAEAQRIALEQELANEVEDPFA